MQVKGPRGGFPTLAVMESVYHRILVAIDPEGVAEKALQHALALAHAFEAQVRLVYVIDPYGVDSARCWSPQMTVHPASASSPIATWYCMRWRSAPRPGALPSSR